ncbi:MAG: hypothetical protein JW748_06510 [Anaerolineales bacterium]|nr:hypothetical protein [Anaerolineales bacterium]
MQPAGIFRRAAAGRSYRFRKTPRGQILVLALIFIMMFFLVAVALIDVYSVTEARAWGYRAAQAAALAGASRTTGGWIFYQPTVDPSLPTPTPRSDNCMDPVRAELDPVLAADAAYAMLDQEMQARGFAYNYEIRVLPDFTGGTTVGWPPGSARLGGGDWSSAEPAVGVYLWFDVHTFLSGIVGRSSVTVHVFAAAGVAQPLVCPP